jgi:tetratricopeptide (TPR) repeat protein
MKAEERIEIVQAALQRRFRIAGRGSVNRVQRELRLGAGYFKNQRRSGRRRVDLKILFRALEALEVDSAEFFAAVLGPADPVDSFKTEAAALLRGARQPPAILVHTANRSAEEESEEVDLAALEALRNENPRRLIRRIRLLVPRVEERQLPELLGIYASAARALGKMEEAQIVLAHAIELAEERDDPALLADLLQRASYVMAHGSQADKALALSEKATLHYVRLGDLAGIGKTLVDQGVWHGYLEHTDEELVSFLSALHYLPAASERPDVRKNRFSCLMNLGITYRKLDDPERAGRYAAMASEVAGDVGPKLYGKLLWLEAAIARESGRVAEAEGLYRQALEVLGPVVPIDAALSSVELVRFQLGQGRAADAYSTAKELMVLVQPLENHRLASAALTALLRCALTGRGLSAAFLDRVARGLEQGRLQQTAAARRKR